MNNDKNKRPQDTYSEDEFTEFDFQYVHADKDTKIHDEEFKSKPTTFAKDALRRFAKNKASVVGAVIIGILLLGSFLSGLSPYKINEADAGYGLMLPKIRDGGDGWWDGTTVYTKAYDKETGMPIASELNPRAVLKESIVVHDDLEYYTEATANGHYGYYHLTTEEDLAKDYVYMVNYSQEYGPKLTLKASDEAKMKITVGGLQGLYGNQLSHFDVYLNGKKDNDFYAESYEPIPVQLNIKTEQEKEDFNLDLSGAMTAAGINTLYYAQISIQFPKLYESGKFVPTYILIESINLSCAETADESTQYRLKELSFTDAGGNNWETGPNTDTSKDHTGYWQANVKKLLYGSFAQKCTFRYDQYLEKFGLRDDLNAHYGKTIINRLVSRGLATLSDPNDLSTFALVNPDSDECPVRKIEKVDPAIVEEYPDKYPDGYNYTILGYRHFNFTSMPKFIFGTDNGGRDLLTLALSCLKNSLLLAIITSAICLTIGLVWGSCSGYFGGNVDLIMERITDILSGVPWIVVMTLVMILLGRTYITFGIAVCLTGWIGTSARTRTQFYRFKGREYVLASRTLGASDARLIFRHILPNGLGTIVTGAVLMIPSTIFSEATLSYLGLGLQGTDSFGVVLSENQRFLQSRPALVIFPAIIVSLLMISFNLFGNGLRDALNPTLKGGEQ